MRFVPERILRCGLVTTNRVCYIAFADQSCLQNPMYATGGFKKMIDTDRKQEIEFAAFVGIDWADQKHAWALQIPGHLDVERQCCERPYFRHSPEVVESSHKFK